MNQATIHTLKVDGRAADNMAEMEADLAVAEAEWPVARDQLERRVRQVKERAIGLAKAAPELVETEALLEQSEKLNLVELELVMQKVNDARLEAIRVREAAQALWAEVIGTANVQLQSLLRSCEDVSGRLEAMRAPATATEPAAAIASSPPTSPPPLMLVAKRGGAEQREFVRQKLQVSVNVASASNLYTGFSQNISEGGLFVATTELAPKGTELELEFSLPRSATIKTRAIVRWIQDPRDRNDESTVPGMGLQFLSLDGASAIALNRFVAEREPLFFPED